MTPSDAIAYTKRGMDVGRLRDCVVATADDKRIGYACAAFDGDEAELTHVFVDEEWRNNGIGSLLVQAVAETMVDEDMKFTACAKTDDKTASQFLTEQGFIRVRSYTKDGVEYDFYEHEAVEDSDELSEEWD